MWLWRCEDIYLAICVVFLELLLWAETCLCFLTWAGIMAAREEFIDFYFARISMLSSLSLFFDETLAEVKFEFITIFFELCRVNCDG